MMSVFPCWITLPDQLRTRKRSGGNAERVWFPSPPSFPPIAHKIVNDTLAAVDIGPWQPAWDSFNCTSHLLKNSSGSDIDVKRVFGDGFWARDSAQKAWGQVVGLALLGPAEISKGLLSWRTPAHRFWQRVTPKCWQSRMTFLQVLDIVAIGSFVDDGVEPFAGDDTLLPVALCLQSHELPFSLSQT